MTGCAGNTGRARDVIVGLLFADAGQLGRRNSKLLDETLGGTLDGETDSVSAYRGGAELLSSVEFCVEGTAFRLTGSFM